MTTIRIGFDDWNTLDIHFLGGRLWLASAVLSSTQSGVVVTERLQKFDLPSDVVTQMQIPPTAQGQAYYMVFAVRGFHPSEYFFQIPDTTNILTLVDLLENYQVSPTTLQPLPSAPPSIQAELDSLQSQIDGISAGVLPGGHTNDVMTKNSDTNGDASWKPLPPYVEGYQYNQITPLATWTIAVPGDWTRIPDVTLYDTSGEQIEADISASLTQVSIQFPYPFAGSALLT